MSYLHHNHPGNGVENCHHEEDETGSNAKCLGVDGVKDGRTDHQAQHFNTSDCTEHCACIDTGNRNSVAKRPCVLLYMYSGSQSYELWLCFLYALVSS